MKSRVLVISSANIDFVQNISRIPESGETVIENLQYKYVPGGKGANSALTFARLGGDAVLCAKIGKDENGERLKSLYNSAGIDTRYLIEDKFRPTGLASIMVERDGSNRIIVYPGANSALSPDDVEEAFNCMPDGVFVNPEIPDSAIETAAEFARRKGIPFFIDAGPIRPGFNLENISCAEIVSPNESECKALTDIYPDSVENCLRAAIRIASMTDIKYVVLKLGARGSFVYDGKYYDIIPAHKVQAVDTTAAGDVYTAALSYAYMQKGDIREAARFATLAAAISVTRQGASSSIPTLKEVKAFAKKVKEA